MKILVLLNSPNWSGASYYCIQFAHQMQIKGHNVLLLTEPGKPCKKAKLLNIKTCDWLQLNSWQLPLIKSIKKIIMTTLKFKPDIITSHINEAGWVAAFIKKFYFPSAIAIRFRTDIPEPKSHFINKLIHNKWFDHIIVSSNLHKCACIKNLGLDPNKISVIYAPINHNKFSPLTKNEDIVNKRVKLNLPTNQFLVGIIARLDPIKGHEYALQAVKLLPQHIPIKLIIICYESLRKINWLKNEIRRLGILDKVMIFDNFLDNIEDYIQAFDLGLITSLGSEANCRVALEFMSCQKPVIATKVGVIPEIISNFEDGILINPGCPEEIADSIIKVYNNQNLRSIIASNARNKIISKFTLDIFSESIEKLLIDNLIKFHSKENSYN